MSKPWMSISNVRKTLTFDRTHLFLFRNVLILSQLIIHFKSISFWPKRTKSYATKLCSMYCSTIDIKFNSFCARVNFTNEKINRTSVTRKHSAPSIYQANANSSLVERFESNLTHFIAYSSSRKKSNQRFLCVHRRNTKQTYVQRVDTFNYLKPKFDNIKQN